MSCVRPMITYRPPPNEGHWRDAGEIRGPAENFRQCPLPQMQSAHVVNASNIYVLGQIQEFIPGSSVGEERGSNPSSVRRQWSCDHGRRKRGGGGTGDASPAVEKSAGDVSPEIMMFQYLFSSHIHNFYIFQHLKIKWPKSEEKLNFGGR